MRHSRRHARRAGKKKNRSRKALAKLRRKARKRQTNSDKGALRIYVNGRFLAEIERQLV